MKYEKERCLMHIPTNKLQKKDSQTRQLNNRNESVDIFLLIFKLIIKQIAKPSGTHLGMMKINYKNHNSMRKKKHTRG